MKDIPRELRSASLLKNDILQLVFVDLFFSLKKISLRFYLLSFVISDIFVLV